MTQKPRSHEDLRMSGEGTVWIAVTADVAYATVTNLPRMGEWSPENCGGEWDWRRQRCLRWRDISRAEPRLTRRVGNGSHGCRC